MQAHVAHLGEGAQRGAPHRRVGAGGGAIEGRRLLPQGGGGRPQVPLPIPRRLAQEAPAQGGWVDVAGMLPGDTVSIDVAPDRPFFLRRGSWIANSYGVQIAPKYANDPTTKMLVLGAALAVESIFKKKAKGGASSSGGGDGD